ncbi:MAG: hypothetical protein P1P84_07975 [Deferrisomatales bacterium]|nr:hypothetical protein [Deferrisomatales bacterium]
MHPALRIALCTYSATRNTAVLATAAAQRLAGAGHTVEAFDMLSGVRGEPPVLKGFDLVGLATPVMLFRPPWVARRFLEKIEALSAPRPAFLILSSAGLPANSADTLRRLAAGKGLVLGWCREVTCADSFIPFRRWFGTGRDQRRPDAASLASVEQFVDEVVADRAAGCRRRVLAVASAVQERTRKRGPGDAGPPLAGGRRVHRLRAVRGTLPHRGNPHGGGTAAGGHCNVPGMLHLLQPLPIPGVAAAAIWAAVLLRGTGGGLTGGRINAGTAGQARPAAAPGYFRLARRSPPSPMFSGSSSWT